MRGPIIIAVYAVSVLLNGYIIGRATKDRGALPFFIVPVLSGPFMLALALPYMAALMMVRLGAEHAERR